MIVARITIPVDLLLESHMCFAGDEVCRGIADVARLVYQCARSWGPGSGPDVPSARSNVLRRHMIAALHPDGTAAFEACLSFHGGASCYDALLRSRS